MINKKNPIQGILKKLVFFHPPLLKAMADQVLCTHPDYTVASGIAPDHVPI